MSSKLSDHSTLQYRRYDSYRDILFRRKFCPIILACFGITACMMVLFFQLSTGIICFSVSTGGRCFWPFNRPYPVILISMDSFRHDYLEIVRHRFGPQALPNFARLESTGVRAGRSINVYPTVTLPNHHTLVTGLYPIWHGMVANTVADEHWPNITMSLGDQRSLNNDPWFVGWPEPIWVTLQRAGGLAGSVLWPLTDQPVKNDLPFQQVSEFSISGKYMFEKRIRDVLWWLNNPRYHLDLILAYFNEPDESGHAHGPFSLPVAQKIVELDRLLGELLDGLEKLQLRQKVDIILTADHGMVEMPPDQLIPLDEFLSPRDYTHTVLSTNGFIYPKPGKAEHVYNRLHGAHKHMKVYWLEDTPEWLHFNQPTARTPPIIIIADPHWRLVHNMNSSVQAGNHGYPPNVTGVNPFFIASGPSFRVGHKVDRVHAVDVYPLMCSLLHIEPQPNNGSLARIRSLILKQDSINSWFSFKMKFLMLLSCVSITITFLAVVCLRKIFDSTTCDL